MTQPPSQPPSQPYVQDYALTLNRFLEHAAKWHPDAGVVTARGSPTGAWKTTRLSYPDLYLRAQRFSAGLLALGVCHGDRIATLAWNTEAHFEAWFAIAGIGAVVHTLNPRLAPETLANMVNQAECRVLIVSANLAPMGVELARISSAVERIIVIDETIEAKAFGASVPVSQHHEVTGEGPVLWGDFDESSAAGLCFTSGTTGDPKGVVYTHRSSFLHTMRLLQTDVTGLSASDRVLMVVPMFHANGWGFPFAAPTVGASLVMPGRHTDGASLARLIATEGVTIAAAVPTLWLGLLDHIDAVGGELTSLKRIIVGGAPMGEQLMERIEQRLGVIVQTSWGMTELSPVGALAPAGLPVREAASAGRISIGLDLLLKDGEGKALPQQRGVEGRLHVKGQSVVQRYYGQENLAVDSEGWFDTGDLAKIGANGSLYITGRAKDLIKSGGEWINPAEIEAILATSPAVTQTAVIARRDAKWGERPILIVEVPEAPGISDSDLLALLRGRVPSWWLPDAVVRVAKMPLAATGKIDKRKLRVDFG